jgi:hypothetical protein
MQIADRPRADHERRLAERKLRFSRRPHDAGDRFSQSENLRSAVGGYRDDEPRGNANELREGAIPRDAHLAHVWTIQELIATAIVTTTTAYVDIDNGATPDRKASDIGAKRDNRAREFVTGRQWELVGRVMSVENMNVRAANPAAIDAQ